MKQTTKLSGLLALAMLLCIALACSDSPQNSGGSGGSTVETTPTASKEFTLDKAEMRKDEDGEMSGETTTAYTTDDRAFHCYINWDNPKANTRLKFIYAVVNAGGAKNQNLKEISLTTENELQNEAFGKLTLTKPLPKGSYKVDIFVNDKLVKTVPFSIE